MKKAASIFIGCVIASPVLAEEQQTLKEVNVTAVADAVTERRESSTQKVVMDRKEIEKMSVMTIGEVLGKLPGVELSSGMGQRARDDTRFFADISGW